MRGRGEAVEVAVARLSAAAKQTGLRPTGEVVAILDSSRRPQQFRGSVALQDAQRKGVPKNVYFKCCPGPPGAFKGI